MQCADGLDDGWSTVCLVMHEAEELLQTHSQRHVEETKLRKGMPYCGKSLGNIYFLFSKPIKRPYTFLRPRILSFSSEVWKRP
mmetsp:Transcript_10084/g.35900  ORF Transcript_10084/g.35900 Transcript_10084/m.35900 type:complete len:83 (-) Transcript_10084:1150-1398(-)